MTMKNTEYSKALADPRWQKKRLEKMQAAEWKCEICKDGTEELHVHHLSYRKSAGGDFVNPWDYELNELKCLCKTCHTIWHCDYKKVIAHCKRLGIVVKRKFIDRTLECLRLAESFNSYDKQGFSELLELQMQARKEHEDWYRRIQARASEIKVAMWKRMEDAQ